MCSVAPNPKPCSWICTLKPARTTPICSKGTLLDPLFSRSVLSDSPRIIQSRCQSQSQLSVLCGCRIPNEAGLKSMLPLPSATDVYAPAIPVMRWLPMRKVTGTSTS